MFELFDRVYSERIEDGHYRIFTADKRFTVFVKVNTCINRPVMARLIRNIARQVSLIRKTIEANR